MGKSRAPNDETYSEEEAQRRFEALVKSALNTLPQPKEGAKTRKVRAADAKNKEVRSS